jgi:hypothetical protein
MIGSVERYDMATSTWHECSHLQLPYTRNWQSMYHRRSNTIILLDAHNNTPWLCYQVPGTNAIISSSVSTTSATPSTPTEAAAAGAPTNEWLFASEQTYGQGWFQSIGCDDDIIVTNSDRNYKSVEDDGVPFWRRSISPVIDALPLATTTQPSRDALMAVASRQNFGDAWKPLPLLPTRVYRPGLAVL